jgi:hypothetical protein
VDPACRTCGIATMLDFNTHAVDLFKKIDGNVNRGLFVRGGRAKRRTPSRKPRAGSADPRCSRLGAPRAAAQVTFGSLGMQEFITNWVLQVQKKNLGPFVVGALDGGAIRLCQDKGYPAAGFGALTMNTTGAYWRQDEGTFLRMANLKTELLRCGAAALPLERLRQP